MTEDGWLIERNDVHLCYSSDGSSCYRWVTFTDPAAWRFETKEAAEQVIRERGLTDCRAEGHTWVDVYDNPPPEPIIGKREKSPA